MRKIATVFFVTLMAVSICACGGKITPKETKEEVITETESVKKVETEKETEKITEKVTEIETIETDTQTQEMETETEIVPFHKAKIIDGGYETSYVHIDSEMIRLGNDEEATVTFKATPAGLQEEDILFLPKEELIDYDLDIHSDESGNTTEFVYTIYGINPGSTDLYIGTSYDYYTMGDEASFYCIPVKVFDAESGQVVYVTETGKKYHFSADCAGDSSYATTLSDAEAEEMAPCGKCAQ